MPYGMPTGPKNKRNNNARVGDWTRTPAMKKTDPANSYRVKSGDTLSGIAKKYGTSVNALYKMNPKIAARKAAGNTSIFSNTLIKVPGSAKSYSSETRRENRGRGMAAIASKSAKAISRSSETRRENRGRSTSATTYKPKRVTTRGN